MNDRRPSGRPRCRVRCCGNTIHDNDGERDGGDGDNNGDESDDNGDQTIK